MSDQYLTMQDHMLREQALVEELRDLARTLNGKLRVARSQGITVEVESSPHESSYGTHDMIVLKISKVL